MNSCDEFDVNALTLEPISTRYPLIYNNGVTKANMYESLIQLGFFKSR